MKIKQIDRAACTIIRERLDRILAELGDELGMSITVGSGSFTNTNVTFKVQCAVKTESGQALTKEATAFHVYAPMHGLNGGDLGRTFWHDNYLYKILGWNSRSHKYPIIAERVDDYLRRKFKFPPRLVQSALNQATEERA